MGAIMTVPVSDTWEDVRRGSLRGCDGIPNLLFVCHVHSSLAMMISTEQTVKRGSVRSP